MGEAEFEDLLGRRAAPPPPERDQAPPVPRSPAATLTATGLAKRYEGVTALDDVSVRLAAGEILGLIGPNGSGKSTLLSCLSGLQRPDRGTVTIGERRLDRWSPLHFARAGVGRTFQSIRLFGALSALDNVRAAVVARGAPEADARAWALLSEFSLRDVAERPARSLPYGAQRRLEIARALAGEPTHLLLDEPAAGMNPSESADLMATLRRVRDQRGLGILIVDHDLHLILSLCDRVIVLNEGRLLAEGPPASIRDDPAVGAAYFGRRRGRGRPADSGSEQTSWVPQQRKVIQ